MSGLPGTPGETAWNTERRLQGHIDIPCRNTGLSQARSHRAQPRARGCVFRRCATATSSRARQARGRDRRAHALPPARPRLRERHYGHFQGLTFDEAEHRHQASAASRRATALALPDDGESLDTLAARAALGTSREHAGETVVVVCGGVLDIASMPATGPALRTARAFAIPNAALNWIEHTAGSWKLVAWADEKPLQGMDELPVPDVQV